MEFEKLGLTLGVLALLVIAGMVAALWFKLVNAQKAPDGLDHDRLVRQEAGAQERVRLIEATVNEVKLERESLKISQVNLQEKLAQSMAQAQLLETEKRLLEQQLQTLRDSLEENRKNSKAEFENLAQAVLETKTKTFTETTEKSLELLLKPLRERIQTFEKTVDDKYTIEAKERHALKSEIEKLIQLNDKMTFETSSLTAALRGDSKVQGDWGELVLERILEASGLREGHEYSTQSSHQSSEGERYRPDVIIKLPDDKHVVVDSKVSLKAYDLYRSQPDESLRAKILIEHIKSIDKHIDELSEKHYSRLKGLNSPEIVFMFVPIEPAYLAAMQADHELSTRAWKKGVALVTSTTLLTSLKTVASIWRLEKQNKNALEIAQEGAKLYDKFVGFVEDFEKIGQTFEQGSKQFHVAMGKLKEGPGNVFRKIEVLRELGAAPTKRIKQEHLE